MKNSIRDGQATRDSPSSEDDEPIQLPALDNSALIRRFRFTVVGRVFHTGGRSMEAFLAFMPSAGIWDVEGRARGFDLGNGRFHFNFESEEDLQKILKKRPCHFNKWTFSLERWELNFQEDLLSFVTFWVKIRDLPLSCWAEEAFRGIGDAIGRVSEVDVTEARVLVAVNVTKPLKFKKRVLTDNGEEVMVSLTYEKLFRYCFTCHLISHEERDCPHLSENQKQLNKDRRGGTFANGGRRPEEGRALAVRRERELRDGNRSREERRGEARVSGRRSTSELSSRATNLPSQSSNPPTSRQVRRNRYLTKEVPRPDTNRNPVWQRIGGEADKTHHRNREPSIQSSSGSRKKPEDVPQRTLVIRRSSDGHRIPLRRRESPLRIRSPPRDEPSLETWRSSRRPPRHQGSRSGRDAMAHQDFPAGCGTNTVATDKGKGKMIVVDDEPMIEDDDDVAAAATPVPSAFEFGSGSGLGGASVTREDPPPLLQEATTTQALPVTIPVTEKRTEIIGEANQEAANDGEDWVEEDDGLVDWEEDNEMSDWAEDDTLDRAPEVNLEIQSTQEGGSIPSDWENLAEEEVGHEEEITEEDVRLMQELEQEMILDGLLENDDLLGEDLLVGEPEGLIDGGSPERTISEQIAPISHQRVEVPATSQSPSSKRTRSPTRERKTRKNIRTDGPVCVVAGPSGNGGISDSTKAEPKKQIPQSPKIGTTASRKLKLFGGKASPRKRSAPSPSKAAPPSAGTNIPQNEAVSTMNNKDKDKKKVTKALKPRDGEEEPRISPDPPA